MPNHAALVVKLACLWVKAACLGAEAACLGGQAWLLLIRSSLLQREIRLIGSSTFRVPGKSSMLEGAGGVVRASGAQEVEARKDGVARARPASRRSVRESWREPSNAKSTFHGENVGALSSRGGEARRGTSHFLLCEVTAGSAGNRDASGPRFPFREQPWELAIRDLGRGPSARFACLGMTNDGSAELFRARQPSCHPEPRRRRGTPHWL
jgi:hypothetical protein